MLSKKVKRQRIVEFHSARHQRERGSGGKAKISNNTTTSMRKLSIDMKVDSKSISSGHILVDLETPLDRYNESQKTRKGQQDLSRYLKRHGQTVQKISDENIFTVVDVLNRHYDVCITQSPIEVKGVFRTNLRSLQTKPRINVLMTLRKP